jgi:hypothetical protein
MFRAVLRHLDSYTVFLSYKYPHFQSFLTFPTRLVDINVLQARTHLKRIVSHLVISTFFTHALLEHST